MRWPERPTNHDDEAGRLIVRSKQIIWRPPDDRPPSPHCFRSCSYCGSMHPEDLLQYLKQGARLGGADWKYGWPHKFYVRDVPNPLAGQIVPVGSRSSRVEDGTLTEEPILGPAPIHVHAKWYNSHLKDQGFDEEALASLLLALKEHSGIEFKLQGGDLQFIAPVEGYQR